MEDFTTAGRTKAQQLCHKEIKTGTNHFNVYPENLHGNRTLSRDKSQVETMGLCNIWLTDQVMSANGEEFARHRHSSVSV